MPVLQVSQRSFGQSRPHSFRHSSQATFCGSVLRQSETRIDGLPDFDDGSRKRLALASCELTVATKRRLDLVGDTRDCHGPDGASAALERVRGIDPAGQLTVTENNGRQLSALLAKQDENVALEFRIAEGLIREMLDVENGRAGMKLLLRR